MGGLQLRCASSFATAIVAAALLLGCGAEDSAEGNAFAGGTSGGDGDVFYDPNVSGGQTGSLMPQCGLAPAARTDGIPSSAEGFVLYTGECSGAFSLDGLSLQNAQGQHVAFDVRELTAGAVLITPMSALAPGDYRIGHAGAPMPIDEDAGGDASDDDAGTIEPPPDLAPEETLRVTDDPADSAASSVLGQLYAVGEPCNPRFDLTLDPKAAEVASLLALELRIDMQEPQPFIAYGTLERGWSGTVPLALPKELWDSLSIGAHELTLIGHVAGQSAPLQSSTVSFDVPSCSVEMPFYSDGPEPESDGCSAVHAPRSRTAPFALVAMLGALALLARRTRTRGSAPIQQEDV